MKYECVHARETEGIPYIVCDREPSPSTVNKQEMYHALCPYQRFCGQKRCAVLLPEWIQCVKNATERPQEGAGALKGEKSSADIPAKKSAQKRRK